MEEASGEHLVFFVGPEKYAFPADDVQELISPPPVIRVPQTPSFLLGVINLRGNAVPLIDLRIKFSQPTDTRQFQTTVLVIQATIGKEKMRLGVLVDEIAGVAALDGIKEPADLAHTGKEGRDYISGLWIGPDRDLVMTLDPGKLFVEEDFSVAP
ncbi:MAG: purine-binding chemotaxis protein CheW [Deltaproteobacteria bacterium]|nr:purine-binding chemotaxis protein CheW [Deltaproteobacteria bacterium]